MGGSTSLAPEKDLATQTDDAPPPNSQSPNSPCAHSGRRPGSWAVPGCELVALAQYALPNAGEIAAIVSSPPVYEPVVGPAGCLER